MKNDKLNDPFYVKELLERLDFLISVKSAENSLYEFLKQAWPVIEGKTPFIDNWHLSVIAQHLEACYRREIKNLLINVPPRTSKTSLISIAFPAWVWLQNSEERFMYASYAHSLSTEHSLKCRRLIESDWYQNNWRQKYKLAKDQKAKMLFENNKGGCRIATSVGSVATGKGGNIIVVDDGNNARDGESEVKRESTNSWWDQVLSTRLNNPLRDVRIVVQQRLHEKDMSGHIIANDIESEWVKLIIPMEFEEKRKVKTVILSSTKGKIWEDPRKKEGELLWPERFPSNIINRLQRELGSYGYAGQYQQRPAPAVGGILQKSWFKKWEHSVMPRFDFVIQSWDTAFSDKPDAAYSACTTWGIWGENSEEGLYKAILISMWRGRVGYPELRVRAQRLSKDYKDMGVHKNMYPATNKVDVCLIEAKATGDPLIRDLRAAGVPAVGYIPKGDKHSRVQRVAASIECGLVYLPTEEKNKDKLLPFADEFLESVITFPNAESRDLVDTMTQTLSYLKDHNCLTHPKDEYEDEVEQPTRKRLY